MRHVLGTLVVAGLVSAAAASCPPGGCSGTRVGLAPKTKMREVQTPQVAVRGTAETPPEAWAKRRAEAEKQLNIIRFHHFGDKGKVEVRQAGIAKLRDITDEAAFPGMLEILGREKADVVRAVCDHLMDINTDESWATLAYASFYGKTPLLRDEARTRFAKFKALNDDTGPKTTKVLWDTIEIGTKEQAANAATMVQQLGLIKMIPALINGQIISPTGGGGGGGYIATLVVGTQRAFVQDVEPVVGDGAIAFDPVPGVITEGTVLAVNDAVITIETNPVVHTVLLDMTRQAAGVDMARLGHNREAWHQWYYTQGIALIQKRQAAAAAAEADAAAPTKPAPAPTSDG